MSDDIDNLEQTKLQLEIAELKRSKWKHHNYLRLGLYFLTLIFSYFLVSKSGYFSQLEQRVKLEEERFELQLVKTQLSMDSLHSKMHDAVALHYSLEDSLSKIANINLERIRLMYALDSNLAKPNLVNDPSTELLRMFSEIDKKLFNLTESLVDNRTGSSNKTRSPTIVDKTSTPFETSGLMMNNVVLHVVHPKESYHSIAKEYDVKLNDLIKANYNLFGKGFDGLAAGDVVAIPTPLGDAP